MKSISKAIKDEAFDAIKDLPAIDTVAMTKYDRIQVKIDKIYNKVFPQEVYSLDISLLNWLQPRLKLLQTQYEKIVAIDPGTPEEDTYNAIKELIELSDFIINEKWSDAFENPNKDLSLDEMFIKRDDGNYILKESSAELKEYFSKVDELEGKTRDRFTKLLADHLWRLWT